MSPQYDAITGGDVLRIPALQSPNYVAGTSGWIIKGDGTVEFNVGTFRGSLTSGTNPGKHITLNDAGGTGDAVDVYDSGNHLVYAITANGVAESFNPATGAKMLISAASMSFGDANPASSNLAYTGEPNTATAGQLTVEVINRNGQIFSWIFQDQSADLTTSQATLIGNERGVVGSVLQGDRQALNNLVHIATYTITTVAGELQTFNHGASFTPTMAFAVFNDGSATNTATVSINSGTITATQATVAVVYEPFGTFPALNDTVIINVMFVK